MEPGSHRGKKAAPRRGYRRHAEYVDAPLYVKQFTSIKHVVIPTTDQTRRTDYCVPFILDYRNKVKKKW